MSRDRGDIRQIKTRKYIHFRKMAREISPICDFIFGSIWTGLPTDTVDVELTLRMVKGIYTYRKDHTAESMVFSPWSRTIIPFPSLKGKMQAYQDENKQTSAWNKGHALPNFLPKPNPNGDIPRERPELDGQTRGIGSIL